MDTVQDFEDILELFARHGVRYLIVGGLAFIFHAKPRYTKDIDLWIDSDPDNVRRTNRALEEFGSPELLSVDDPDEVLQLGVAPNRIDILRSVVGVPFVEVWPKRIESRYGQAPANFIDLDSLLRIKSSIDHPRHQEDARVLRAVKERRERE
jgi:hypothetical protein